MARDSRKQATGEDKRLMMEARRAYVKYIYNLQ